MIAAAPRTVAPAPTPAGAATPQHRLGWLPEVQGLRTVALLLVATFHIWFGRVSGGVDIFLLISAFLMTRQLADLVERGAPVRPFSYLVRRFARLMPLATGVAAAILLVSVFTLPVSNLSAHLEQFVASALYTENRWLQDALVDYFTDGLVLASPFQHYWSLAIQAQVFLLWPFVFCLIAVVHRRFGAPLRTVALWVFGTATVLGLAWSTHLTLVDQQHAYFDLGARLWEFSAGAVLALVLPLVRLGGRMRGALTWIGLAGTVLCGFVIPVEGTFPGIAALWPVTSAALIIIGAGAGAREPARASDRRGARRLLSHPALTRLGDYTYALYLVHWPVLIIGMALNRSERPDVATGTAYLLISAIISVAAVHLVDRPIARFVRGGAGRARVPWRAAAVVAVLPALVLITASIGGSYVDRNRDDAALQVNEADLSAMGPNADDTAAIEPDWAIPSPWVSRDELGELVDCTDDMIADGLSDQALDYCQSNRDEVDPDTAERTVFVVGNSHAMQLTQLVMQFAEAENWAVRGHLQHGCQFAAYQWWDLDWRHDCLQMWEDATADVLATRPDVVIVMGTWSEHATSEHRIPGLDRWIEQITGAGIDVVAVRDNPRSELHMLDCAERFGFDSERCAWATTLTQPASELSHRLTDAGATFLDLNADICPGGVCRPQVGGLVVFYDDDHVTATYMRALAYRAAPELASRFDWWPERPGEPHAR